MPFFENRALFSDHYLRERLPEHPEWRVDAAAAHARALALFRERRPHLERMNEAQTEEEWVKPLLTQVLGWAFSVQTDATHFGRRNRPDYALFTSAAEHDAARAAPDGRLDYSRASAVGDAKFWGRPLDRELRDPRDRLTNTNPSFQIVNYLVATGVEWGILTNGREWRLYSTRARSRVDTYFAVDLERILVDGGEEAFRWFYLFFRADSFRRDPVSGRSFLEAVHARSVTYGSELEERLKRLIFDEVFEHLAAGFVAWRRERGVAETDESLRDVYGGTLRLLYRLLFLLHAEARELLPVRDARGYFVHSLTRLKQDVREMVVGGAVLSPVSHQLWDRLASLFRVIDRGDPSLNVPRYNGGLFRADLARNAFLEENRLADRFLAPALDHLARAGEPHFIDYKSLSVEQLGSIYEGLLEFRLRLAPEALAVVREKGVDVYRPAAEAPASARVIAAGAPYLENDKGERKVSGSYYTPQYVVEFIVEHAVGPVLRAREAAFRAAMEEVGPVRERLAELEQRLSEAPGRADGAATRWTADAAAARRRLEALERRAAEALLGIRICDPAMGSGHFLVYATDWLTERLIAVLNEFPENPVLARIAEIREEILATLREQGITIDADALKDTNLLKRMVMKRCIYGVDLNPMATELAKLALWLDSFTVGAPLSFLDHHLKTGNSLVGTRVEEVRRALEGDGDAASQSELFGGPFAGLLRAASLMREVATLTDATFQEVALSAVRFEEFEAAMGPYKRILDLWVSRHFGNPGAEEVVRMYGDQLVRGVPGRLPKAHRDALAAGETEAAERHFFHWDLEFPEVFVDLERAAWKEDPGFDAVIGNPPYVRQELLAPFKPFLRSTFRSYSGTADLYLYFFEQAVMLLRQEGRMAYVSSGTFARANFAAPFRRFLPEVARLDVVVDFGENQPFEDAEMVRPSIVALTRTAEERPFRSLFLEKDIPSSLDEALADQGIECDASTLAAPEWVFQPAEHARLYRKIVDAAQPLGEIVGGRLNRGVLTGLNEAFMVNDATRERLVAEHASSAEVLKQVLRGEDLRPWYHEDEGRWLIVFATGWTRERFPDIRTESDAWGRIEQAYPAIAGHLRGFEPAARKRGDKGEFWWELRPCDYYGEFDLPKIFWPDISKLPRFSLGDEGVFVLNTGYLMTGLDPWVLGYLQSRVAWFSVSQVAQPLRLRGGLWQYRLLPQFLTRLPVPTGARAVLDALGSAAQRITSIARDRYTLHQRVRHRIATDLGQPGATLNRRLTAWWDLDFPAFRREVTRALDGDIPLAERDDWEAWLGKQQAEHRALTDEIVRMETELNARVYALFKLTPDEIAIIEESTAFRYGEV
jgi:hypothetical protein